MPGLADLAASARLISPTLMDAITGMMHSIGMDAFAALMTLRMHDLVVCGVHHHSASDFAETLLAELQGYADGDVLLIDARGEIERRQKLMPFR